MAGDGVGPGSPGASLGLIAGNGRFPFLLLDAARAQGLRVVVAAIKEETDAEMERGRRRILMACACIGFRWESCRG